MIQSYKDFWKRYADFKGVSTRPQFWWPSLINFIICNILTGPMLVFNIQKMIQVMSLTSENLNAGGDPSSLTLQIQALPQPSPLIVGLSIVGYIFALAILCPSIANTVRRLRDAGYSWGWIFISLVPFAGPIIYLVILAKKTKTDL